MYQESHDKMNGSSKTDTIIFIALIVFFLIAGTLATVLRSKLSSNVPLYALAAVFAGLIYIIYRLRIVGWRYTVFYSEPQTEYDPRFDDYITHEDHPYPVGTVVFERTVSAKGEILAVIKKEEMISLLEPGMDAAADEEFTYCTANKSAAHSLLIRQEGKTRRVYFTPSEEFITHLKEAMAWE